LKINALLYGKSKRNLEEISELCQVQIAILSAVEEKARLQIKGNEENVKNAIDSLKK
jgi:hypothetical protein